MKPDAKEIRVLLVSPMPPPAGGIASWTDILVKGMQRRHQVRIRLVDTAVRWRSALSRSLVIKILGGSFRAFFDILRVLFATITFRADVLHVTSAAGYASWKDIAVILIARTFAKGGVIHYHTSRISRYGGPADWRHRAVLGVIRRAAAVIVLDGKTLDYLEKLIQPPTRLKKIPNMIDLEEMDRLSRPEPSSLMLQHESRSTEIIFVGHVVPEKGLVELVEVCAGLERVRLRLVGPATDSFRSQLERIASTRSEGKWLQLSGPVTREEVFRHIMTSDILVLPSHDEAFPMALLEAMAFSKPVLVTDVGAMREIVLADSEDACGICVAPQNRASLRSGLERLLEKPEMWKEYGRRGRKRIENLYALEPVFEQLVECWQSVAGASGEELHRTRHVEA